MSRLPSIIRTLLAFLILGKAVFAQDVAVTPVEFNDWFPARIARVVQRTMAPSEQRISNDTQLTANGQGIDRQASSPSVNTRSTSLVDQSSASDFFSAALTFVPMSSVFGSTSASGASTANSGSNGSTSVSATLYAIIASAHGFGVTDADYYSKHPDLRRFSFSAGSSLSNQATDNTTNTAATLGVKVLLLNGREIFNETNQRKFEDLEKEIEHLGKMDASAGLEVLKIIEDRFCPDDNFPRTATGIDKQLKCVNKILPNLPSDILDRVDAIIAARLAPAEVDLRAEIEKDYDDISQAPQVSIAYSADLRNGTGYTHHRGEFIADFAYSKAFGYTINAGSEYIDRKGTSQNSTGGRLAAEGQYQFSRPDLASTRSSLTLSFSGEGDWLTKQKPQYKGQVKIQIPLTSGISLPIAYSYENRAAQLDKSNSEAKVGLSIDFAKVIQGLKR